jgi:hypothetical protein
MVSIIVALSMIVPGIVLTQQFKAEANTQSGPTTYAWVSFDSPTEAGELRESGANIVSLRELGAYVKVTENQRKNLKQNFEMNDLPERTMVTLFEQGISFDSQVGYGLPAELRNAGTNEYLVQFVAPTEEAWNNGVQAISGRILHEIGNNLVVVKMSEAQKAKVEKLDYVQWVGAYEPGFKMDQNIPSAGTVKVTIDAYELNDVPAIIGKLNEFGATGIEDTEYGSINCYIAASALPAVARMDSVKLVWNLPEMKTMANVGGRIAQVHDLWDNSISNLPQNLMGQGQIIHVQDTALDATHRDFTSGALGNRIGYVETATDPDYHGTHCTGIAAGNGYNMAVYLGVDPMDRVYNELGTNPAGRPDRMPFAGRAPEATIYSRAGLTTADWAAGFTFGARVFTNSWGPATINNAYSSDADSFMTTNPTALVLFAAGNDGPRTNTVSGGGNGKLGVSVGAVENMRPIDFDSSDDYNQMASFSSRGPVSDGFRVKPDVCEYGTAVYSTKSDDADEASAPGLYDENYPINTDPDAAFDYISLQGTSMACPAAAGDSIIIRDYLVDVRGIAQPHANLMKTLLIHGSEDMGLGYPSFDQGWGRVNVRNSIAPAFPNVLQWRHHDGIASGSWNARTDGGLTTWVVDDTVPLKVTMVHWDASGSGLLTYDLDLVVTSPTGVRYEGNAFKEGWSNPCTGASQWGGTFTQFPSWVGGNSYDWDTSDDGGDDRNNVEIFRVKNPAKGQWNIQVVWRESTARPFTVAITGGFNASADINAADYAYRVNMHLNIPRLVPERDDFGEGTFKAAPDGSVIVPFWLNNGGTTSDSYTLSTPLLPTGFTATFYPTSPVSVNAGIRRHMYARIMVGSTVTAGSYTLGFKAVSIGDTTAPFAQSTIKFQVDVVTQKTPPTITVAGSPAHEAAPSFVSWTEGSTYYIGCAYTQDTQFGDRVFFTLSSDGGATWGTPVVVSAASWGPGYLTIERATSGTYVGRLGIAYNAWNPDGVGGNTADTRCSYIKFHYSTDRGTSWSTAVDAWALGTGVSTGNTYRTINLNWASTVNQFYLTVECFGYSGTDLNTATMNAIACIGKASTDGGATWGAQTRIDPAVTGMYYFFPSVERDMTGNLVLFFYERDSSDAAQDRDATYKYYTGTWSAMRTVWDTTDNLMMPQSGVSNEGANANRAYGAYLKGAHTDGDRYMFLTYTDNPAGNPPTFTTNIGPLAGGVVMSDHDYGTRFVFDIEFSNAYTYLFGHRNVKYDPYGQPNLLACYDNNWGTLGDTQTYYMTLDSFVHGKQRATTTTHGGVAKVFVAQNVMTPKVGHDIVGMHVYNGWQTATDTWGPVTEYVSANKVICNVGDQITVIANVHEWTSGGNNIRGAQYNVNNGTWVNMQSLDGAFNSPAEAVESTTTKINTATWTPGAKYRVYVRGQDNSAALNWGASITTTNYVDIWVNPQVPATATVTGPSGASSAAGQTIVYEWEGIPTSVNLYYTTQTVAPYTWVLIGNENPVDGTRAWTAPAGGTYGFKASAVGGATTELSPPANSDPPERWFTYDNVPPAAPGLYEVDRWGPTAIYGSPTTETRYLRGVANEATVNGLTAYSLDTTNSNTAGNWAPGNNVAIHLGMRVYVRSSAGVETEISSGLVATASRTAAGSGFQTATWTPPETYIPAGSSIVIKVYGDTSSPPTTLRATFTTAVIGEARLDANQWTVQYWTRVAGQPNGSDWYWGTGTYDNNIAGFQYTPMVARDPLRDNTLNWTASTSLDVAQYRIYRAATEGGTYTEIATVPFGTNTYVDTDRGNADATLWWYRVRAEDLAGNIETNTNSVQELGGGGLPPYPISLTGKTASSWVFVSFPSGLTGNIETILNDATSGDGLTTWTVAKWYNPQTPADPWKTYRVGGTANDMPTMTNAMGVWLWITGNSGDQVLTLSSYVATPASTEITLYAGWNLVGYPSSTNRLASATLPGTADIVSVYSGSGLYTDYTNLASATMSHGNAYFVHVTATTPWTVTNP